MKRGDMLQGVSDEKLAQLGLALLKCIAARPRRHDLMMAENFVGWWSWDDRMPHWWNICEDNIDGIIGALDAMRAKGEE